MDTIRFEAQGMRFFQRFTCDKGVELSRGPGGECRIRLQVTEVDIDRAELALFFGVDEGGLRMLHKFDDRIDTKIITDGRLVDLETFRVDRGFYSARAEFLLGVYTFIVTNEANVTFMKEGEDIVAHLVLRGYESKLVIPFAEARWFFN